MTAVVYGCYRSLTVGGFLFDTRRYDSPLPYTAETLAQLDADHLTKLASPVKSYSCVVWRRVASWEFHSILNPKYKKG